MNKYYRIVFGSSCKVNQEIFVMTTEKDSEEALQNFIQDAFSSYQEDATSFLGDPDDLDPEECEELDEEIRNSCYLVSIEEVDENACGDADEFLTTDDADIIEW